jgi:threonine dehydrogenase-like Zn-dependent dehydrogenase
VVAVPRNLCARVPDGVDLRHAAFTTLAAIAMQGVRQADLALGANCVVVGLGLVGLLTVQLLEAAGVQAIGVDLDPRQVDLGREAGASLALERRAPGLEEAVLALTRGAGTDAVVITAATTSHDPVELAGRLCRHKGRVVIVGVVPTGFSREAYYKKELDLRMSCSYGPGRYDARYEEGGVDYPIGYVRWTENRNMQAYLDLLARGRLDPEPLISHAFPLERAPEAYQMILDRAEPFVGILLAYDTERPLGERVELTKPPQGPRHARRRGDGPAPQRPRDRRQVRVRVLHRRRRRGPERRRHQHRVCPHPPRPPRPVRAEGVGARQARLR